MEVESVVPQFIINTHPNYLIFDIYRANYQAFYRLEKAS